MAVRLRKDNMESNKSVIFEQELQKWMQEVLSPYCLNECKISCCDCEGTIKINKGYEHLFKTNKLTGEKIPVKEQNSIGAHLFEYKGVWYFGGKTCPNYDVKAKKCLIHNEYPRCALYPLVKNKSGYMIFSVCSLHKLKENQEPLKSLIQLCKKHNLKLFKEKSN